MCVGRGRVAGGGGEVRDGREGVVAGKGVEMELGRGREGGGGEELPLERRVLGRVVHLVWTVKRGGWTTASDEALQASSPP